MMQLNNPVQVLSDLLAHAMYVDFPLIEYETRDYSVTASQTLAQRKEAIKNGVKEPMIKKTRHHEVRDMVVVAMFPQMWGSTALGFGGIGGQAMTNAYTIIVTSNHFPNTYCVYFNSGFAYRIETPNKKFFDDMNEHRMLPVKESNNYKNE